jgi:single-stranded-DNA-specific exonuclease
MNSPLSITNRRWTLAPADHARRFHIHSLHPLVARCLSARIGSADVADWLRPAASHLHDPGLMKGMPRAVERLRRAVSEKQRVRIVTDYDVDGTTSSLILQSLFRILGCGELVDYHIPDRFKEGYGFSVTAAEKAAADGIAVIVTADIGVKDHAAVTAAAAAGVDVIICDHHLPAGESVPQDAHAVLCPPQEGCGYPNKALAACGVSLKLAQAMLPPGPRTDKILLSMMKVAAIGTVADVVDLSGLENRAIVTLGLEQLRAGPNAPGLQALLDISGLSDGWIDASDIGYKVSPRINAAGRLAGANTVVELFAAQTREEAYLIARQLDTLNKQRQDIERELVERCLSELDARQGDLPHFVVLAGEESAGWHRGVVGIVASRIRDRLHRPAAIISISEGSARGSIRSTPEVHAVEALESASEILEKFGGHPAAAGFSVHPDLIPALARQLDDFARQAAESPEAPALQLDADCAASDISWSTVNALQRLGPHGKGNPRPLLWVRGVRPAGLRVFAEKHLKFRVGGVEAIWWQGAQHIDRLHGVVDLAAEPGINRWQGSTTVRLTVLDAATSGS